MRASLPHLLSDPKWGNFPTGGRRAGGNMRHAIVPSMIAHFARGNLRRAFGTALGSALARGGRHECRPYDAGPVRPAGLAGGGVFGNLRRAFGAVLGSAACAAAGSSRAAPTGVDPGAAAPASPARPSASRAATPPIGTSAPCAATPVGQALELAAAAPAADSSAAAQQRHTFPRQRRVHYQPRKRRRCFPRLHPPSRSRCGIVHPHVQGPIAERQPHLRALVPQASLTPCPT